MFDTIKGVIGDIASGSVKDQRIALSHEQLTVLDGKFRDALEQVTLLTKRISQLEFDKANLEAQIQKFRPEIGTLDQQSKDILKFFFDRPDGLTSNEIAQRFKLSASAADYHVDVLFKRKFLQQLTMGMSPRCCINHNGREFVMTHAG
jgi:DNA-directed RNA polymerase specialized sigma subunit